MAKFSEMTKLSQALQDRKNELNRVFLEKHPRSVRLKQATWYKLNAISMRDRRSCPNSLEIVIEEACRTRGIPWRDEDYHDKPPPGKLA
jgi:hypothetical protein